jgi:hypothetical protein
MPVSALYRVTFLETDDGIMGFQAFREDCQKAETRITRKTDDLQGDALKSLVQDTKGAKRWQTINQH